MFSYILFICLYPSRTPTYLTSYISQNQLFHEYYNMLLYDQSLAINILILLLIAHVIFVTSYSILRISNITEAKQYSLYCLRRTILIRHYIHTLQYVDHYKAIAFFISYHFPLSHSRPHPKIASFKHQIVSGSPILGTIISSFSITKYVIATVPATSDTLVSQKGT
jgi:hypothetical protein